MQEDKSFSFFFFNRMQLIILIKPIHSQRNFAAVRGLPLVALTGNPPWEGSPEEQGGQGGWNSLSPSSDVDNTFQIPVLLMEGQEEKNNNFQ